MFKLFKKPVVKKEWIGRHTHFTDFYLDTNGELIYETNQSVEKNNIKSMDVNVTLEVIIMDKNNKQLKERVYYGKENKS